MKAYLAPLALSVALLATPAVLAPMPAAAAAAEIKYVVNGEPITSIDIQRRASFLKLQRAKGNVNQQAADQMIEQTLRLAEMKRMNIRVTDKQVDDAYARFASSNKMQLAQLDSVMSQSGVTKQHFKQFIRTQMGWGQVVGARMRGETTPGKRVSEQEAVRQMFQKEGRKASATEYMLQEIIFVVPAKERGRMAVRKREAEAMRSRYNGCNASRQLAKGLVDVTVRDLGRRLAPELPPNWADAIKSTSVGRATPVRETERGVEFIGICSSREVSDDRVSQVLLQTEGIEGKDGDEVSKQYIKELREKATIVSR